MSSRSVTWPLILILIGIFFLITNVRPDLLNFSRIADYWPFLLIGAGVIGLIEVLIRAGQGVIPPRPVGGSGIFWIVLLCLFFAFANRHRDFQFARFNTDGVSFFGSDYDYDVNSTEPAQGVTRVVLDNIRGNLSLKGSDANEVRLSGHKTVRALSRNDADKAQSQNLVHMERRGDQLVIRAYDNSNRPYRVSADLEISVPRGVTVESRGRSGDLNVDDIGGSLEIQAGRGDVRLNHIGQNVKIEDSRSGDIRAVDVKGTFDLEGRGGDLHLENIAGVATIKGEYSGTIEFQSLAKALQFNSSRTEFHAEAVPGSITMDLGALTMSNVTGPVRFQTTTRDIEAKDVTNALDLVVDRGDVEVTATRDPLPRIDVRSRNGNITIAVPGNAAFQLKGSTNQGDVSNDYGGTLETQTSGPSATIKGATGNGPQITLSSGRGDITVRKS